MSRNFRFIRRADAAEPDLDMSLVCAHAADALLVATSLGGSVEVWDGARRVGIVGGEAAAPPPEPASNDLAELAQETETELAFDEDRPFNPFRPGAWRRLRGD